MQRLFNVSKWSRLCEGGSLKFGASRPRAVRLEVNAPRAVGIYLFDAESGEALFLARVEGRDTVEFHTGGAFTLVSDGEVFVYTAGMEHIHHVAVDPVIFTRITERRQVNPEIAAIQRLMQINIERRLAEQRNEFNAALARVVQGGARQVSTGRERVASVQPPASDNSGSDGEEPASDDGGEPAEPETAPAGKRKRSGRSDSA